MFSLVIMPVFKGLTPEDQKYFRESREAAFGTTLEKASRVLSHSLGTVYADWCSNPVSAIYSSNMCQKYPVEGELK